MNRTSDAIIVGGGVIGLLTARELVAGGLSVTVLERDRIGMASSQAGGGILAPIPPWDGPPAVTALAIRSSAQYAALSDSLLASSGIDIEYLKCGVLLLGVEADAAAHDWAQQSGQKLEVIDTKQLRELEPQLHDNWHRAVWLPGLGQLRNPRLTRALHRDLQRSGVELLEHTPVTQLRIEKDRVIGVCTPYGDFDAAFVIIAAGAWTSELLGELAVIGIRPVRGQMLWYQLEPGTFGSVVIEAGQYLIPRRDGVCLIGSTVEHVGFEDRTTRDAGRTLAGIAARLSPVFEKHRPAGQWSGLRPGSPEGVPVISAHPGCAGLFIHAGHYRNGINLGPASAGLLADIILSRQPVIDPGPYLLRDQL